MGEERLTLTRRSLLQIAGRAIAVSGIAGVSHPFARGVASAQTGGAGRAVVCIYLFGGNDSNNLVVPLDAAQYRAYAEARGALALPADALLPVKAAKGQALYGFHPSLAELRQLYNAGALAVVANVGSLVRPVTKAAYRAGAAALPADLMAHQYSSLSFIAGGFAVPRWAAGTASSNPSALQARSFTFNTGLSLVCPGGFHLPGDSMENAKLLRAMAGPTPHVRFPETGLGRQLKQVASLIKAGGEMGMGSQVFLASLGGFDTHAQQAERHASLLRELSQAMAAFHAATVETGVAGRVTTYTDSEFGRALRPNATQGTEHGWGAHHLAMGAAVRGGDVYGGFPEMALGGPQDATGAGVWIPTTSRDQYAATLAKWAGIPYRDLPVLSARLKGFASPTLGFVA
jgi:uncharacterized protein (DUF1501 family)